MGSPTEVGLSRPKQTITTQRTTMGMLALRILSLLLFQLPLAWFILHVYSSRLRFTNRTRRSALLREMNFTQGDKIRLVGFFHPYW